ncbi:MAG: DMT family transporter [Oscillospiraceae bacterium]|nr:DMT family transporter [Oscillospiraceae bacterium]
METENRRSILASPTAAFGGAMLCCLLWGSAFPVIKIGFEGLNISSDDTAAEILYAGLRFTLAGLFTIIIASVINKRFLYPSKRAMPKVFALSLFQTILQYFFFYIGLSHTSGVKASVIEAANVFVALVVSCIIFRMEKFTAQKLIGSIIGFAGVVVINLSGGFDMELSFKGEGFILLSTVAYAFSSVLMKRWSNEENPMMMSGWQFLFGGMVMAVCGFAAGGRISGFDLKSVLLIIYLALVSAVAYSLWSMLLKYHHVSKLAVYGLMNPVFGVLLSALLLGETEQAFGARSFIALALVCIGILVSNKMHNAQ